MPRSNILSIEPLVNSSVLKIVSYPDIQVGIQFSDPNLLSMAMELIRRDDVLRTRCLQSSFLGASGQGILPEVPETEEPPASLPPLGTQGAQEFLMRMNCSENFNAFVEDLGCMMDNMNTCMPAGGCDGDPYTSADSDRTIHYFASMP
jgi:hypothetical protein